MITIKRGLDLPIAGTPEQRLTELQTTRQYAVLGEDYIGLKPTLRVAEGDKIKKGQILFEDKKNPGVVVTAPVAGEISAINRGKRRSFRSLVIDKDESLGEEKFAKYSNISALKEEVIKDNLIASGEWTSFRTRPFNKIPAIDSNPAAIFVTAIDTNPLRVDPSIIVSAYSDVFYDGLMIIGKLTQGSVYICTSPKIQIDLSRLDSGASSNYSHHVFNGVHPAGLASTHIHHLYPVDSQRTVWTINYQDVIAIGKFFREGSIYNKRHIAFAGPQVNNPCLVEVERGISLTELSAGKLKKGNNRIISGSVLSGTRAENDVAFLGRYHLQVSVIEEGGERPLLHYLVAGRKRFSTKPVYLSNFTRKRWSFTASSNGSPRAMVPIGAYEEVMPLDILPTQLLRALIVGDSEKAQNLGCLELVEEDLALCTYVCPGKYEYGPILRDNLTTIELEG